MQLCMQNKPLKHVVLIKRPVVFGTLSNKLVKQLNVLFGRPSARACYAEWDVSMTTTVSVSTRHFYCRVDCTNTCLGRETMSSDTWASLTSRQDVEQLGRRVFEWCKEHPIKFSAYATFVLLSLFPVFVFLLFTICSIIGTVLFLVLFLLIGLIILAAVCSIVLCCSGCVAASVTVAYLIVSSAVAGIKWIIGLFNGSTSKGDSLKES